MSRPVRNSLFLLVGILIVVQLVLGFMWSSEPKDNYIQAKVENPVIGAATTATLQHLVTTLLDKPGGYLRNDKLPPGVLLDNIPSWEYGVLQQARDMVRVLRNDFSRSQSQSKEDADLATAEGKLNISDSAWILPSAEGEYRKAYDALDAYKKRLTDPNNPDAQFYARADNLNAWLALVEKRLGDTSQTLSASIANIRENTDLAGDSAAVQSSKSASKVVAKTPWMQIDNVFYEARGTTWALSQLLHAIEIDFAQVLEKKNATASVKQIIRELEAAQQPLGSPVILNGSGFGFFANHSLVMASYVSRANAAIIDLRQLLSQG